MMYVVKFLIYNEGLLLIKTHSKMLKFIAE